MTHEGGLTMERPSDPKVRVSGRQCAKEMVSCKVLNYRTDDAPTAVQLFTFRADDWPEKVNPDYVEQISVIGPAEDEGDRIVCRVHHYSVRRVNPTPSGFYAV